MFTDFIVNGQAVGSGEVGRELVRVGFDVGLMRPYLDEQGRPSVTVNTGRFEPRKKPGTNELICNDLGIPIKFPVYKQELIMHRMLKGLPCPMIGNATTLFPKGEWQNIDAEVSETVRTSLNAYADLASVRTYNVDGMANPILEWERVTAAGQAVTDMDGMTEARNFAPKFGRQGIPLPITHADYFLSSRFKAASLNRGANQEEIRGENGAARIAELIEKTAIGLVEGDQYGDSTDYDYASKVYGLLNHPDRLMKINMPVPDGTNGDDIYNAFIACREMMYANGFRGPFQVYTSTDYDAYLDGFFSATEISAGSLRSRLLQIQGIRGIRTLEMLVSANNPFTLIFVDMNRRNVGAINGLGVVTVQWPGMGGFRQNYKILTIQVPFIRSVYTGNAADGTLGSTTTKAGVLVATTS